MCLHFFAHFLLLHKRGCRPARNLILNYNFHQELPIPWKIYVGCWSHLVLIQGYRLYISYKWKVWHNTANTLFMEMMAAFMFFNCEFKYGQGITRNKYFIVWLRTTSIVPASRCFIYVSMCVALVKCLLQAAALDKIWVRCKISTLKGFRIQLGSASIYGKV